MASKSFALRVLAILLGFVLLAPGAVSSLAATPTQVPAPGGLARVIFLRQFLPSEGLRMPMIFVNGAPLASSQPGTTFYRDFPPGNYTFSVETCTIDTNQAATLNLAPGSQVNLEIQSLSSFRAWGCPANDTFYVRVISPAWAQFYSARLTQLGAR